MSYRLQQAETVADVISEEPVVDAAEVPVTQVAVRPGPVVPATLVGMSMGGLALVVGTFVGALIAPKQDLRYGFLYALGPSIAAGVLAAHVHRTDPMLSAKIISTTTGMTLKPVATQRQTTID